MIEKYKRVQNCTLLFLFYWKLIKKAVIIIAEDIVTFNNEVPKRIWNIVEPTITKEDLVFLKQKLPGHWREYDKNKEEWIKEKAKTNQDLRYRIQEVLAAKTNKEPYGFTQMFRKKYMLKLAKIIGLKVDKHHNIRELEEVITREVNALNKNQ